MLALSSAVSVAAPARQRERSWCRGFDLREEKVAVLMFKGIRPDTAPDGIARLPWRRGAAAILTAAAALVLSSCSSGRVADSTVKATQAATAPVEAAPSSNETTTQLDPNEHLSKINDITWAEAFNIGSHFYPDIPTDKIDSYLIQCTQAEIDTIREASVGQQPPSVVSTILNKYGFGTQDWLS